MIQLGVSHAYIGIATFVTIVVRTTGGSIATTIYSAMLQNYEKKNLPLRIASATLPLGLPETSLVALIEAISLGSVSAAAIEVAVAAFKRVYLVSITFGAIGIVAALFTLDLNDKLTTEVSAQVDNHRNTLGQRKEGDYYDEEKVYGVDKGKLYVDHLVH